MARRRIERPHTGAERREQYTGQTTARPANVSTDRIAATAAPPSCVIIISLRRSNTSAATPASIEKTKIGTTRTRPTSPSARPRRSGGASKATCHRSAACCMKDPENETMSPIQRRRKFR